MVFAYNYYNEEFLIIVLAIQEKNVKMKLQIVKNKIDQKLKKYNSGITLAYSMFAIGDNFQKVFKETNKKLQILKKFK